MTKFAKLEWELKGEYPKFGLIVKEESKLMRAMNFIERRFNSNWMDSFVMTIGYKVYMPRAFFDTELGYQVLRHEAIHVKDYHRFKWLFFITYLMCLPSVFTMRAFWEMRGYRETMKVEFEETGAVSDSTLDFIEKQFVSANYFWMLPFKPVVRKWLNKIRKEIV